MASKVPFEEGKECGLDDLIQERRQIDQTIRDRFERRIVVMFTDIVSSSSLFEIHGDLAGREMLHRHNLIVIPLLERYEGRVIKSLGDGLMVAYEIPLQAALAAMEVQKALREENEGKPRREQIRLKISLHTGNAIIEESDIIGDVVNTSQRINSIAGDGQILASGAFIDAVRDEPRVSFEYEGARIFKSKTEPVEVYRVLWDPSQAEDRRRSTKVLRERGMSHLPHTLHLSVISREERLLFTAREECPGEEKEEKFLEIPYRSKEIFDLASQMESCLAQAAPGGRSNQQALETLKSAGGALYKLLFPSEGSMLWETKDFHHLVLHLDESLALVPWELLHDGEQFLCLRYAMGRLPLASFEAPSKERPRETDPLKMLVATNPRGDLKGASTEGKDLAQALKGHAGLLAIDLHDRMVGRPFLEEALSHYDWFHFAGHAVEDPDNPEESGLALTDGWLTPSAIFEMARSKRLPSLVFTNACRSSSATGHARSFNLARAFVESGVRHYIGSTLDLYDRSSAAFAREFYEQLLKRQPAGEALRQARIKSIARYGEAVFTWASYNLHGNPATGYFARRTGEEPARERARPPKRKVGLVAMGAAALLAMVLLAKAFWLSAPSEDPFEKGLKLLHRGQLTQARGVMGSMDPRTLEGLRGLLALSLVEGNVEEARARFRRLEALPHEDPYGRLAEAHLAFLENRLDAARESYSRASENPELSSPQRAEAFLGLARIRMHAEEPEEALKALDEALRLDPGFTRALTAKGIVLERRGRLEEALEAYGQAARGGGPDPVTEVLSRRAARTLAFREEAEKRERVDNLVEELESMMREGASGRPTPAPLDPSAPIPCFLLDFQSKGRPALREGEDEALGEWLQVRLQQSGRLQLVERALLDEVLRELKLSASELAAPETALPLGRILAARFIVAGSVLRLGGDVQVTLRAIDTETTRITALASESLGPGESLDQLATRLSRQFVQKVDGSYGTSDSDKEGSRS